jgi:hypothetical protein
MDQPRTPLTLGQRVLYGFALWLGVYVLVANIWQVFELLVLALIAVALLWHFGDDALRGRLGDQRTKAQPVRTWMREAWVLMRDFPRAAAQLATTMTAAARSAVRDEPPAPKAPASELVDDAAVDESAEPAEPRQAAQSPTAHAPVRYRSGGTPYDR